MAPSFAAAAALLVAATPLLAAAGRVADHPIQWNVSLGTSVGTSLAVSPDGSQLVLGADDGRVYSLSPTDGSVLWRTFTAGPVRSSPKFSPDGGSIVVGSDDLSVYCLNATFNGSIAWTFESDGAVTGSAGYSQEGACVAIGSADGGLYYLTVRPQNGTPPYIWTHVAGSAVTSGALVFRPRNASQPQQVITAGTVAGDLIFVNEAYGQLVASFAFTAAVRSTPVLAADGNSVLVGADDGSFSKVAVEVDVGTAVRVWTFDAGAPVTSTAAVDAAGSVYFTAAEGATGGKPSRVYALRQADGTARWSFPPQGGPADLGGWNASVVFGATHGLVYAASTSGVVVALRADSGTPDAPGWQVTLPAGSGAVVGAPALSPDEQHLFVATTGGRVFRLAATVPPSASPTPTGSASGSPPPSSSGSGTGSGTRTASATASLLPPSVSSTATGTAAPTPTGTPAPSSEPKPFDLGIPAIVGIVVGVAVGIPALAGGAWWVRRLALGGAAGSNRGGDDDGDAPGSDGVQWARSARGRGGAGDGAAAPLLAASSQYNHLRGQQDEPEQAAATRPPASRRPSAAVPAYQWAATPPPPSVASLAAASGGGVGSSAVLRAQQALQSPDGPSPTSAGDSGAVDRAVARAKARRLAREESMRAAASSLGL